METPLVLTVDDGQVTLPPDADSDEALQPVHRLVGRSVTAATYAETGSLRVEFTDSATLTVEPDPDYEAWNVLGPNGLLVVCMPGGELAFWSSDA